ncbi:DUF2283 domain-containing protein [Candidatus Poribacteria bacterium]|nr:DUF2283 domain-containing protein [Candidatus Poribacteria bacterium]
MDIKICYDSEGDYLEVIFERKAGYFRETENDAVMEKVDEEGNTIGFSILKVISNFVQISSKYRCSPTESAQRIRLISS